MSIDNKILFIVLVIFLLIFLDVSGIVYIGNIQHFGPVASRVEATIYGIRNDRTDMYPQFETINNKRYSTELDGSDLTNQTLKVGDRVRLDLNSDNYVITFIDETEQVNICAYAAACKY